jgi:hypothetical protein
MFAVRRLARAARAALGAARLVVTSSGRRAVASEEGVPSSSGARRTALNVGLAMAMAVPIVGLLWTLYRLLGNGVLLAVAAGLAGAVGVYLGAKRTQRRPSLGTKTWLAEAESRQEDAR